MNVAILLQAKPSANQEQITEVLVAASHSSFQKWPLQLLQQIYSLSCSFKLFTQKLRFIGQNWSLQPEVSYVRKVYKKTGVTI